MPFAKKFQAMVDFPFAGDTLGSFTVESVDVQNIQGGSMGYIYGVRMVLQGLGGQAGVRKALKNLISSRPVTFSGYGNPYQLWFRKPTLKIESLGNKHYEVMVEGAGMRIYLDSELKRFLLHLEEAGVVSPQSDKLERDALVTEYLEEYKTRIARKVSRYYGKMRRYARKKGD
jgi:hypothetical protein